MEMTMGGVVRTEEQDGIMVIHFQSAKIHEDTAIHQFLEELGEYIDSTPESRILINMENLDYSTPESGKLNKINQHHANKEV